MGNKHEGEPKKDKPYVPPKPDPAKDDKKGGGGGSHGGGGKK
ncbi:hypothetical protein GCM10022419_016130 [Nonomuraea rosea]|uniref:Uncharacterized protein n=1 Tax=Nonomuraea rosea TaxID=638574 RepID=A0ABP6VQ63_9ACTN